MTATIKTKHEVDMLKGPIFKGLLAIALPVMLMNVLQSLFTIIDMTLLRILVDDSAVGAVGVCSTLITAITGLMIGISVGANVVVSRHVAKNDQEGVERAVGSSILFSLVGGLVLTVISLIFAETFLKWLNCPDSLLEMATTYFRIYFLGAPFSMLYNFSASILRSMGDSRRAMYFLSIGGICKIGISVLITITLHTTVEGVAIGTVSSFVIAGGLCFLVLLKSKSIVKFKFSRLNFYWKELKETLFIGIPTGIQNVLYAFANVVISATVNTFGPHATTGISIANNFDGILYQVSIATSFAVLPFVSQNVSVGNIKRANEVIKKGTILTILFSATLGSLSAIFSAQLSSIISQTPEVIAFSQQKMIIISSTYFICGIQDVMFASLRGIGKPIIPTITAFLFQFAIRFFGFTFYSHFAQHSRSCISYGRSVGHFQLSQALYFTYRHKENSNYNKITYKKCVANATHFILFSVEKRG